MSFTAEVKDELSRVTPRCPNCEKAELAALIRLDGTLSISGPGLYRLEIATETSSVARAVIRLLHEVYGLKTELIVRRSVLHKTHNYLIMVPAQKKLPGVLANLGIMDKDGLSMGIDPRLVINPCCAAAYLRGAFLGGGFIADPHGDFHFELICENEPLAQDLVRLMERYDIGARITKKRGAYAVYIKGAEPILTFLTVVGAHKAVLNTEDVRVLKSMRNDVNRRVNAEIANQTKSADASMAQLQTIERIEAEVGLDSLPPALEEFARLRLAHPELNLRELGEAATPPLTKSAIYHRIRRLDEIASDIGGK